ncbi:hydantoinase/carbamoylase family amidase [Leptobacterium flavescens]|uniref:Hydantoinase/carbamoylase family amidase n=1 Tax=Leptobacterium flavescens TaxID=472055 RepID=A0A6P0UM13_9FLAO|nr:Zn-dependent hydrolase [Leptobacterium flavescens]NER13602.1 hydantoinase/carbamoylase family amidase [Leptobacterium flavescens]
MFSRFFLALAFLSFSWCQAFQDNSPKVNQQRLEATIFELAKFGRNETGGTSRVAFSQADLEGRKYVIELMKKTGLEVSVDFAGNIIGRRKGKDPSKKPIAFGSHIDTVPDGGNYDGCVGSMSAIEVMQTLFDNGIETDHPLELIIFSNEEGGLMGSRALAGKLGEDALRVVNSTGFTMREGISILGGDPARLKEVERKKGDLAAFLELHIEQGGILDQEKIQIGVVEGIVGINWWDVEIDGFANHAGTTPMNMRRDALLAASEFVIAVNEVVNSFEGSHVGTVGRIKAFPGAPNVIPGKVVLSLEIRDLSSEKIAKVFEGIKSRAEKIAKASGTTISFNALDATGEPALTDSFIKSKIAQSAKELGLSFKNMPSGAGHDAQDMAVLTPTGMIFVPSKGGISHSPKEFTSAEDMANGANVLLRTVLTLDRELK